MPSTDSIKRKAYNQTYYKTKKDLKDLKDLQILSPHYYIQWTRRVFKLHREFYKSAWFARWKYELLQVHSQLISPLETGEEV
jgi:hypothetical protein